MTAEARLRAVVKRLEGPNGTMTDRDRFVVMARAWSAITHAAAYNSPPRDGDLVNLAAHCVVWAKELDRERPTAP